MRGVIVLAAVLLLAIAARAECNIAVEAKEEFVLGEKVEFYNRVELGEGQVIEYWAEDEFGTEVKRRANTTNNDKKSFTPKEDGVFVIKNRVIGCDEGGMKAIKVERSHEDGTKEIKAMMEEDGAMAKQAVRQECRVYKSGGARARGIAVYGLVILSVLLNIVLIWRR